MDLLNKANENMPRSPKEIEKMLKEASKHYYDSTFVILNNQNNFFI